MLRAVCKRMQPSRANGRINCIANVQQNESTAADSGKRRQAAARNVSEYPPMRESGVARTKEGVAQRHAERYQTILELPVR